MDEHAPQRKHLRKGNHDYKSVGTYFITICTHEKRCFLSKIKPMPQSELPYCTELTEYGAIAEHYIQAIPLQYPNISVAAHTIMPNHIHLLFRVHQENNTAISSCIGWLKYRVTSDCLKRNPLQKKIFQRSFHDRIVRNETEYFDTYNYIVQNPCYWSHDELFVP